jgi:hypothetical protein
MESSFDLMTNPLFDMTPRQDWMMPTPFVLNDAVVITQKIKRSRKIVVPAVDPNLVKPEIVDSLTVAKDSLRIKQKGL